MPEFCLALLRDGWLYIGASLIGFATTATSDRPRD